LKIGIVNDSVMAAEVLRRIVISCPDHQLLWIAENGAEAVLNCQEAPPDLILMDLLMPVMDGVAATRQIIQRAPSCAILIVTASVTGNASMVFEAMGAGALDVVATPVMGTEGLQDAATELLRKIEVIGKLIGFASKSSARQKAGADKKPARRKDPTLVAIGASTGGPQALTAVLSQFPADFPAAVVIVQHMDKKFTHGLATWLDQQAAMPVRVIAAKERPQKGVVLVPSTDHHLTMAANGTLAYSVEPADNFYHPSVDVFFQSLSKNWTGKIIGVLLTGMGRDGAAGLLSLKDEGHYTIAQDEESSVVYGMPKAAKELDAAREILPIHKIGARIVALAGK
jgi:two-component system response regulator WspF